jgi:polyferredoxin/formate hydrogenlyase subunit 6/NADH:ubiquinone oxidoreductase subunit I
MAKKQEPHPLVIVRRILQVLSFAAIIVLLCGAFEWAPALFGWLARLQFIPAVLALNAGAFIVLVLLTVLFGRIYCSVICPLGILQDAASWLHKGKKNRFGYRKVNNWLRYSVLVLFIAALVAGFTAIAALIEPYSMFGRMVAAFSSSALVTRIVAGVSFAVIVGLAFFFGRWWCGNVCPVGTILGLLSRFSLFKPVIDTTRCNGCKRCARNCRSSCIDAENHTIDYSVCVVCMDCLSNCRQGAIHYQIALPGKTNPKANANTSADPGRRAFITGAVLAAGTAAAKAQEKKVDGGLATILDKKVPARQTRITPPGSESARNMYQHCTACQLCVTNCPQHVLRPSTDLAHFMQPEASYEKGYCRPECTICSDVCPAGAIKPITVEEKSSTQIGHAVWVRENCVVLTDGVTCGNCARHCPSGAIQMVDTEGFSEFKDRRGNPYRLQIPVVNEERCIGCGACENLCPARPFSAIYVEGHQVHKTI